MVGRIRGLVWLARKGKGREGKGKGRAYDMDGWGSE